MYEMYEMECVLIVMASLSESVKHTRELVPRRASVCASACEGLRLYLPLEAY